MRLLTIAICCLVTYTHSHSWIACTDYLEENGDYWKPELCRGFPRHGYRYSPKNNFGDDNTGYKHRPMSERACPTPIDDNTGYTDDHPMAVYYIDQKVVIAHPTKGHASELCSSKYIPDSSNKIYRSSVNVTTDPTYTQLKKSLVADFGTSPFGHRTSLHELITYPKKGYQNAPKFCENKDKALATNAFYVPDIPTGRYTFMWEWKFTSKSPKATYTTCWEVDVVRSKNQRDQILLARGLSTNNTVLLHSKSLAQRLTINRQQPWRSERVILMDQATPARGMSADKATQPPNLLSSQLNTTKSDWTSYGPWSACSVTCGRGEQTRQRNCISNTTSCAKPQTEIRACVQTNCQIRRIVTLKRPEIRITTPSLSTKTQDTRQPTVNLKKMSRLMCLDSCLSNCYGAQN